MEASKEGLTRRFFIGGLASAGVCGAMRGFAAPAGGAAAASRTPNLKFGVVSDIHISVSDGPDFGIGRFVSALEWFRDQGVDAVMIPGDLADTGIASEMQAVADAWFKIFPDDRAPDGRRVERLFIYGNHDWDGWTYFPELVSKLYPDPGDRGRAFLGFDQKGHWERIWHEPFSLVWRKEVKGYSFVGAHWTAEHCIGSTLADEKCLKGLSDFYAKTQPFDPSRPFFHFQHPHPKNTCYGPWAWGHDEGESTRLLSRFPNAIAISGHSHYALTDERSVWQGAFTSIGAASLSYAGVLCNEYFPEGYENSSAPKPRRWEIDPFKTMPDMTYHTYDGGQGMLVSVFDDHVRIARRDMVCGKALGDDWLIPFPSAEPRPFDFAVRAAKIPAPEFPAGAALRVRKSRAMTRGGTGPARSRIAPSETDVAELSFPAANAKKGARVLEYRIDIEGAGKKTVKRLLAEGFYLPEDSEKANASCVLKLPLAALPKAERLRFTVHPSSSLGRLGRPLSADLDLGPSGRTA